ncbi:hypothetical protein G7Y89_g6070 [Cudoniella acicularis]|uniref:Uncharacterized protein n=1 Tax=Cudoniella acicularis TaxID=354080 RepID=A0A8H4W541_9HELO|nr:hypothetical protein G7Y89_g6070 [Cudoniella acicularis]
MTGFGSPNIQALFVAKKNPGQNTPCNVSLSLTELDGMLQSPRHEPKTRGSEEHRLDARCTVLHKTVKQEAGGTGRRNQVEEYTRTVDGQQWQEVGVFVDFLLLALRAMESWTVLWNSVEQGPTCLAYTGLDNGARPTAQPAARIVRVRARPVQMSSFLKRASLNLFACVVKKTCNAIRHLVLRNSHKRNAATNEEDSEMRCIRNLAIPIAKRPLLLGLDGRDNSRTINVGEDEGEGHILRFTPPGDEIDGISKARCALQI